MQGETGQISEKGTGGEAQRMRANKPSIARYYKASSNIGAFGHAQFRGHKSNAKSAPPLLTVKRNTCFLMAEEFD